MAGNHSIIPPSSANRRAQCPGSAVHELMHPETEEGEASKEGTAAHELAEWMLAEVIKGFRDRPHIDHALNAVASNGLPFTQQMYDGARIYVDECVRIMDETGIMSEPNIGIEEQVPIDRIHEQQWGTADFRLYHPARKTLYINDFKFGHVPVEIEKDWQLIEYAAGLVDRVTNHDSHYEQDIEVVMTVVQPRAPHRDGSVRTWRASVGYLRGLWNKAREFEQDALSANPRFQVGPECRFCTGRYACSQLQKEAAGVIQYARGAHPVNMDSHALAVELQMLRQAQEIIKSRLDGVESHAIALMQQGDTIPGFGVRTGKGREKWRDDIPIQQIYAIGDQLNVDLRKHEAITPKQAKDKVRRLKDPNIDPSVIESFSVTPSTGLKLVDESQTLASAIFGKGE